MQRKQQKVASLEVVHIGPDPASKGGIAASISLMIDVISNQGFKASSISTINPGSGFGLWVYLNAFLSVLNKLVFNRPDLVHIHMASSGSFIRKSMICLLCQMFKMPYIIHLHGGGFKDFYCGLWGPGKSYVRLVFRKASVVIALSEFWSEWVLAELNARHVVIVNNGVKALEFSPDELHKDKPTILFLGLLGKNKGTDVLIEAMRKVNVVFPNAVLELCGNGDVEFYKRQARDLPGVIFHGWVNEKERKAALARATIYCLPSWKEGLPLSILEAMSAGLPVISTSVGSIPEVVVDGVSGYLIQPGDISALAQAIIRLLSDPHLAEKMGLAGKELHRERYDISVMAKGCMDAYRVALR